MKIFTCFKPFSSFAFKWITLSALILLSIYFLNAGSFTDLAGFGFTVSSFKTICSVFILCIAYFVYRYSLRYMEGERGYLSFLLRLFVLAFSLILLMLADHIVWVMLFWMASNILLSSLMKNKSLSFSSYASGRLFLRSSLWAQAFLTLGLILLANEFHTCSLEAISEAALPLSFNAQMGLICIVIAAMAQSGVFPFHSWLLASTNSATPVSAFMHAGLINGGGILLVRLSALLSESPSTLKLLFVVGSISCLLGSLSKLVQSSVKNMLTSSTLAQMGFMLMQCGLGLFSSAFVHVLLHGFFKAYLFLNAGSALEMKTSVAASHKDEGASKYVTLFAALFCGAIGAISFAIAFQGAASLSTSVVVIATFAGIATLQMSYQLMLSRVGKKGQIVAVLLSLIIGFAYGAFVHLVEKVSNLSSFMYVQELSLSYILCMAVFIGAALSLFFRHDSSLFWKKIYVKILNFSQSPLSTKTSLREHLFSNKE